MFYEYINCENGFQCQAQHRLV